MNCKFSGLGDVVDESFMLSIGIHVISKLVLDETLDMSFEVRYGVVTSGG